ncbi:MAG: rhodanese-related sulfurtransferase [Chloroflexi bacterium]|nr:rhodanese-related sulfurtransferase [Chloroflexota bacterium]
MSVIISPQSLDALLKGSNPFALIDVRETGEYNNAHIPGASLITRRDLEAQIADAVPHTATPTVLCDDDSRRATLSADTLGRLGYSDVSVLDGGINRWVTLEYPTEWGVNVPSKDFGEKVEVVHHVPEIDAVELRERIERGDELVILDTRTPEEYRRLCIPGGRSVPGAELALRITDITKYLSDDATVVINCAGRTRSIIGTRVLQRMGMPNVVGLKNGTAGWSLAGYSLESGADRLELPDLSEEGIAAAEAYADRLAEEDGVQYIAAEELQALMARRDEETVYLVDVRTEGEYADGHIPGFRWFAGGQAVQRSDEVAVVKNCPIVFCCDGRARAAITASWYRQMGHEHVYAVHGGTGEWQRAGHSLERGHSQAKPLGWNDAQDKVRMLSPSDVPAAPDASITLVGTSGGPSTYIRKASEATIIFVGTSQQFAEGHIPGACWVPRGWLEAQIADFAPDKAAPVVVTCADGIASTFAAATLADGGYTDVAVLEGGMRAWRQAGIGVEQGLSGVMSTPADVVPAGTDRGYADMMNYLRWEEELGRKYES